MIQAVDGNQIIAAFLGNGRVRGLGGGSNAVDPYAQIGSQEGEHGQGPQSAATYAQPVDTVEFGRGASEAGSGKGPDAGATSSTGKELSKEEEAQVRELKKRDVEVRRHEQAHKAAAGSAASGGSTFEYETGPDGNRYAVGGEVQIDTSEASGGPQATIDKMQQVRRAALAPGNPSAQDRAVAAQAQAAEQKARAELREERGESVSGGAESESEPGEATPSVVAQSGIPGGEPPQASGGLFATSSASRSSGLGAVEHPGFSAGEAPEFALASALGSNHHRSEVGSLLDLVA